LALAVLMLDCATLRSIPEGACGNGVVDADEDCDSFPEACGRPDDGARSCRLTCDRTKAGSCPVGWGCGIEGVCRQATGRFDVAGAPTSAGVVTLLAGDFDGDGRADLFGGGPRNGNSKPRVHFFDSNGTAAAPVSLQFPMSAPVVRDFDGDGRDDLAYAFNADNRFGAVGLLAGTADRAFSPVLFPTYDRPATALRFVTVPFDPAAGFFTPNTQGALITIERGSAGTFFRSISGTNITSIVELEQPSSFGPEQVVGLPVIGRIFAPTSMTPPSACGDVVFAYNDGNVGHLAILSPCAVLGSGSEGLPRWHNRPPKDVVLPAKVTGSTLVADIDGGYAEVFITTEAGSFFASSDGMTLGAFKPLTDESGAHVPTPLAVVDIEGDDKLDVVLPTGLYITGTPGVPPEPDAGADAAMLGGTNAVRPATGRWADVRVGNFNGDSLADLVAVSPEALEIEFFANAGSSLFTRFSVPSNKPVRAITTGDFDGDRIQDIAFLASARALGDEEVAGETELLIAYGKASGGPEAARVVGRFKEARGIATVHQVIRAVDEIVVFEATPAKGALPSSALTYVFSSGDRQAIAPLVFRDELATTHANANQLRLWLAASLVAAPLVTPGAVDLMSIAFGITVRTSARKDGAYDRPFPTGAWFAGARPAGGGLDSLKELFRFDPKSVRALDDGRFDSEGVIETLIVAAAADVDSPPDGVSEIVTLTRGQKVGTSDLLIVRKPDLEAGKPPKQIPLSDFAVTGGDDELALVDVDADERPDAVVITRGKNREKLRVYLNDDNGGFVTTPIVLDLPKSSSDSARDVPVAFARIITGATENGKPLAELAVVTTRRLVLAKVNATKTAFETRDITDRLGLLQPDGVSSIAAGDFDGDGVQDLAIADSGSIRLLRQQPRLR
jgi:hypothetical protein